MIFAMGKIKMVTLHCNLFSRTLIFTDNKQASKSLTPRMLDLTSLATIVAGSEHGSCSSAMLTGMIGDLTINRRHLFQESVLRPHRYAPSCIRSGRWGKRRQQSWTDAEFLLSLMTRRVLTYSTMDLGPNVLIYLVAAS